MSDIEGRIVEDRFDRDERAAVFEQRFPSGRKVVGYLPVTPELMADAAAYNGVLEAHMDRVFRPWLYPDPNPFPVIDLFPRWTRFASWLDRVRPRLRRREAWDGDWD